MISTQSVRSKTLDILFPAPPLEEPELSEEPFESPDRQPVHDEENAIVIVEDDDDDNNNGPLPLCAICLEHFTIGKQTTVKKNRVVVPCNHAFHRECIMKWMLTGDENHDDCPTCRQPLWNAETYDLIASKFPPDDTPEEQLDNDDNAAAYREYFEQASQHRRFRLVYCVFCAILVQVTVFALVIYTSNHRYPVANTTSSTGQPAEASTFFACSVLGHELPLLNATVAARCQYGHSCTVSGVGTERACHCLCSFADQALYNTPTTQDCTCVRNE